jgi:hypothetical protein
MGGGEEPSGKIRVLAVSVAVSSTGRLHFGLSRGGAIHDDPGLRREMRPLPFLRSPELRERLPGEAGEGVFVHCDEGVVERALRAIAAPVRTEGAHHFLVEVFKNLHHVEQADQRGSAWCGAKSRCRGITEAAPSRPPAHKFV